MKTLKTTLATTILLILFLISNSLLSQVPGPSPKWVKEDWAMVNWNLTPRSQENSGDEWWYNHTKVYENGVHVGYAAAGYATWDDAVILSGDQNNCYSYSISYPFTGTVNCHDFETANDVKGDLFQTIARYDLDGNMIWCKRFNQGEFFNIIQDSNGDLVAIGATNFVKDLSGNPIKYNPSTASSGGTTINCSSSSNERKMNIVKVNSSGTVIWNYLYSFPDANTSGWMSHQSNGYSLTEYGSGYRCVGSYVTPGVDVKGLMIQIGQNGYLTGTPSKAVYTHTPSGKSIPYKQFIFSDIAVSASGDIAVSGKALYYELPGWIDFAWDAIVVHFTPSLSFSENINVFNNSTNAPSTGYHNSKATFVEYISAYDLFIVPILRDASLGSFNGEGNYDLHYFASDFDPQAQIPSTTQNVGFHTAFDLKMGVAETSTGFATVSTKKTIQFTSYPSDLQDILIDRVGAACYPTNDLTHLQYFETDASVSKYEISGTTVTKIWESTFDTDNGKREYWPGDIKNQECLYGITVDDADGSIVISGNTSRNFDDNYFVKLNPDDCVLNISNNTLPYVIKDDQDNLMNNIIKIDANETWNTSATVVGEIRVKSGFTLTISGSGTTISFADSREVGIKTRIVVEEGATLNVIGATLTVDTRCNGQFWDGIELYGNSKTDQYGNVLVGQGAQPKVLLSSDATISNARVGIRTSVTDFVDNVLENSGGGYVKSTGAEFIDNQLDLYFHPYINLQGATASSAGIVLKDLTEIYNTTFRETSNISDQTAMVYMDQVDGIKFGGCTFENKRNQSTLVERGMAIEAYNSSFSVFDYEEIRSTFEGFHTAVYTYTSNPTFSPFVAYSDFTDNVKGISVNGNDFAKIFLNTFDIPDHALSDEPYGVYMNVCNGYFITENEFYYSGTSTANNAVGLVINNSYATTNDFYKNSFDNLQVGSLIHGDNKLANSTGLEILCNSYDNDAFHIALEDLSTGPPFYFTSYPEIAIDQGGNSASSPPAGNTFNDLCPGSTQSDIIISSGGSSFNYHLPFNPPTVLVPDCRTTSKVLNVIPSSQVSPAECVTRIVEGGVSGDDEPGSEFSFHSQSNGGKLLLSNIQKSGTGFSDSLINAYARYTLSQDTIVLDSLADVLNRASNTQYQLRIAALLSRVVDSSARQKSMRFQLSKNGDQFLKFQADLKGQGKIKQMALQNPQHEYHIWALAEERKQSGVDIPAKLQLPKTESSTKSTEMLSSVDNFDGMFNVFPSPASDNIWIESNDFEGYIKIQLLDLNGKVVKSTKVSFSSQSLIDVSNLSGGIYILRIGNENQEYQQEKISIVK